MDLAPDQARSGELSIEKKIVGIYYLEMELYYRTSEEKEEVNFVQLFDFSDYIDVVIPIRDVFEIV